MRQGAVMGRQRKYRVCLTTVVETNHVVTVKAHSPEEAASKAFADEEIFEYVDTQSHERDRTVIQVEAVDRHIRMDRDL